ncbi:MAG TPA: TIGR03000 domain-containing protein [Gemmata sp.]
MRRFLLAAALVAVGLAWSAGSAGAQQHHQRRAHTTSVTWPSVNPPGWYTNTYMHAWYYPWYAYYDFTAGPYANWMAGGGYAGYAYHGPAGYYNYPLEGHANLSGLETPPAAEPNATPGPKEQVEPKGKPEPKGAEGTVSVMLPADATLLFNGTPAAGSGAVRTFRTPALQTGVAYRYELTAEVVRDGRTERVTESVVVRAGETATVTLTPTGIATAGAK